MWLGRELGYGGEGRVFEIESDKNRVAKIYHDSIPEKKLEKLRLMTQMKDKELLEVAAWPIDILFQENGGPACGVLLPRIDGFKPLHVLYNPSNRKTFFPDASWKFLIDVALDLAEVVGVIHAHDHVIGDINSGNFVVDLKGKVHAIDCDSYQVVSPQGKKFRCEVGVLEYTAPELQGVNFSTIDRVENHDRFGLAVLIFQLFFLGRHPFAGVPLDNQPKTLRESIKNSLFAYGQRARQQGIEKPPFTPEISICGDDLVDLFEKAFHDKGINRPSCEQWKQELRRAISSILVCENSIAHQYLGHCPYCPWCELEKEMSGRFLFPSFFDQTVEDANEVRNLWRKVQEISLPDEVEIKKALASSNMGVVNPILNLGNVTVLILLIGIFVISKVGVEKGLVLFAFVSVSLLIMWKSVLGLFVKSPEDLNLRLRSNAKERDVRFVEKKMEMTEVWKALSRIAESPIIEDGLYNKRANGDLKKYLKASHIRSAGMLDRKQENFLLKQNLDNAHSLREHLVQNERQLFLTKKLGTVGMERLSTWIDYKIELFEMATNGHDSNAELVRILASKRADHLCNRLRQGYLDLLELRDEALKNKVELEKNIQETREKMRRR